MVSTAHSAGSTDFLARTRPHPPASGCGGANVNVLGILPHPRGVRTNRNARSQGNVHSNRATEPQHHGSCRDSCATDRSVAVVPYHNALFGAEIECVNSGWRIGAVEARVGGRGSTATGIICRRGPRRLVGQSKEVRHTFTVSKSRNVLSVQAVNWPPAPASATVPCAKPLSENPHSQGAERGVQRPNCIVLDCVDRQSPLPTPPSYLALSGRP